MSFIIFALQDTKKAKGAETLLPLFPKINLKLNLVLIILKKDSPFNVRHLSVSFHVIRLHLKFA
jgi:hypothetical protein